MEKFYFNIDSHTYEKKNIPSFKEWRDSSENSPLQKEPLRKQELIKKYRNELSDKFPMYHYMGQEIRVVPLDDEKVIYEFYVDEDEGTVHILDLNMTGSIDVAEIIND